MLIIGERINTCRQSVMRAYAERDAGFIRNEALRQAEAGADVIDVNAGSGLDVEPENMAWAVRTVQEAVDLPLCIDSPNPATILAGLNACRDRRACWADSITLEKQRMDGILPACRDRQACVIALCKDEKGIPRSAQGRAEIAKKLVETVDRYGIPLANLYLDPMIEPLCLAHDAGLLAVDTLRELKAQLPQIKTVISLSGISFGLPERKLLHCAFLPILMHEGLDAIFLDPADQRLMATFRAARTILGQDECCMQYIASHRSGGLANGGEGLRRDDKENMR
jgi:cobalamin-dependent methionine synthase I